MKKYVILVALIALMATPLIAQMQANPQERQMYLQHEEKEKMQQPNIGHPMKKVYEPMGFPLWMADELGLREDQIDKIMDFQAASKKQVIDLKADIDKLEIDQKMALKDDDFKTARKIIDQIFDKKAEIAKEKINIKEKINSILTPDQIEKLKTMHKEMPKGHPDMHPKCGK